MYISIFSDLFFAWHQGEFLLEKSQNITSIFRAPPFLKERENSKGIEHLGKTTLNVIQVLIFHPFIHFRLSLSAVSYRLMFSLKKGWRNCEIILDFFVLSHIALPNNIIQSLCASYFLFSCHIRFLSSMKISARAVCLILFPLKLFVAKWTANQDKVVFAEIGKETESPSLKDFKLEFDTLENASELFV